MRAQLQNLAIAIATLAFLPALPAAGQIAPANAAGVAMGHLHYIVGDVAAEKAFWVALGGAPSSFGAGEIVSFPSVMVLISEGETEEGSEK